MVVGAVVQSLRCCGGGGGGVGGAVVMMVVRVWFGVLDCLREGGGGGSGGGSGGSVVEMRLVFMVGVRVGGYGSDVGGDGDGLGGGGGKDSHGGGGSGGDGCIREPLAGTGLPCVREPVEDRASGKCLGTISSSVCSGVRVSVRGRWYRGVCGWCVGGGRLVAGARLQATLTAKSSQCLILQQQVNAESSLLEASALACEMYVRRWVCGLWAGGASTWLRAIVCLRTA